MAIAPFRLDAQYGFELKQSNPPGRTLSELRSAGWRVVHWFEPQYWGNGNGVSIVALMDNSSE